jgi:hypothetical protein
MSRQLLIVYGALAFGCGSGFSTGDFSADGLPQDVQAAEEVDTPVDLAHQLEASADGQGFEVVADSSETVPPKDSSSDSAHEDPPDESRPPARPGACRSLAPQRGLFANGRSMSTATPAWHSTRSPSGSSLPELSNFGGLPGKAGGSPITVVGSCTGGRERCHGGRVAVAGRRDRRVRAFGRRS